MTHSKQTYSALGDALARATPIELAEFHGSLSAALCVGGAEGGRALVEHTLAEWSDGRDLTSLLSALTELEQATRHALEDTEFGFEPLLPEDEEALAKRVAALSLWCHGFVSGLGLTGFDFTVEDASGEVAEVVADLTEISRAALDDHEAVHVEQAEESFMELVEYVRAGVQIVYERLEKRRRATLH